MRIAVLVGNGFDLSLGLETSPDAFLAEFVKENVHRDDASDNRSAADSHPGERLAKTIAVEGLKAWSAYEEKIGEYSKEYSLENVEDYFDEIDALQQFLTVWLSGEDERITEEFIKKKRRAMPEVACKVSGRIACSSERSHIRALCRP